MVGGTGALVLVPLSTELEEMSKELEHDEGDGHEEEDEEDKYHGTDESQQDEDELQYDLANF